MAPRKKPSTSPISLQVHILALADRHAHPYASTAPKYTFTMRLLPDTTLREACNHAADYLSMHFHKLVDVSRLEARDGNGHVFDGKEEIGQELGAGGEVYLIEEALEVKETKKEVLSNLDVPNGKGARTPKAKKVKEPRKTPSQRNLEIAQQGGRMARTEARKTPLQVQGSQATTAARSEPKRNALLMAPSESGNRGPSSTRMQDSPEPQEQPAACEPLVEAVEDSPSATTGEKRRQSASQLVKDVDACERGVGPSVESAAGCSHTKSAKKKDAPAILVPSIEDEASHTKQTSKRNSTSNQETTKDKDAPNPAVASQRTLSPPTSTVLLPSQEDCTIPDSQDPPSELVEPSLRNDTIASSRKPTNAARSAARSAAESRPSSAARAHAGKVQSLVNAQSGVKQKQPALLLSKLDPYDISSVLSDDEYYSPRQSDIIMSSAIRKLGSVNRRPGAASATVPRNSLLIASQATAPKGRSPRHTKPADLSQDGATIPSTPVARAPCNDAAQAGPSSAPGPLLSSPTNHVAAALARGRAKARRQPHPEYVVIEDSDIEVDNDLLVDAQTPLSSSRQDSQSLEASLPWSAPPLRMGGEDPFWTLRTTGRLPSMEGKKSLEQEADATSRVNKIVGVKPKIDMQLMSSDILKAPQMLPKSGNSSINLGSPMKEPTKRASLPLAYKSPVKGPLKLSSSVPAGKSPMLLVHGSSSTEQGVEEIEYVDKTPSCIQSASPSEIDETVIIPASSSQDAVEDESKKHRLSTVSPSAEELLDERQLIEPRQSVQEEDEGPLAFPGDDNETCLPHIDKSAALANPPEEHKEPYDNLFQVIRVPETDAESDNIVENTPPSGQASKRKRDFSNDLDSEEERRLQKKVRREARAAKKAERKRVREEKKAQEEERQKKHQAWLQDERKRLAMEKAYRRARELEIVVSSPTKAAEMGLDMSDAVQDSDQESEFGSSPPVLEAVLPVYEGSDESLESKESEHRPSLRIFSKRHFSASHLSSRNGGVAHAMTGSLSPKKMAVTANDDAGAVLTMEQSQRKASDDWAFLETTLGECEYFPLQTHNKVHMRMMHANLQGRTSRPRLEGDDVGLQEVMATDTIKEELVEQQSKRVDKRKDANSRSPSQSPQEQESAEDGSEVSRYTTSSPAPSPHNSTAAAAQKLPDNSSSKKRKRYRKKGKSRKTKDSARKKRWRLKDQPGLRKAFKRKHALWDKEEEH